MLQESKELRKQIIFTSLPIMMQMLLQSLLGFADTAMLGRVGSEYIAGVSIASSVSYALIVVGNAFSVGSQSLVARNFGAKAYVEVRKLTAQSVLMIFSASFIISLILLIFPHQTMELMGAEGDVLEPAIQYLKVIALGIPMSMLTTLMLNISIVKGNTLWSFAVSGVGTFLNIILNAVFIFEKNSLSFLAYELIIPGFGLKAQGAAIATVITQCVQLVSIVLLYLIFDKTCPKLKDFIPSFSHIKQIMQISLPSTFEAIGIRLAFITCTRVVMSLGTISVAAHSVANTAESISFLPGYAFASVTVTFVGQSLGSGSVERAKLAAKMIDRISAYVMGTFGVLFVIFPELFIRIFTPDEQVISLAANALRIQGFAQIFFSRSNIYSGILKSVGKTKATFYISLISLWCVRVPATLLLVYVFNWGLAGAWMPMLFDYTIKAVLLTIYVKRLEWNKMIAGKSTVKMGIDIGGTEIKMGIFKQAEMLESMCIKNLYTANPDALCKALAERILDLSNNYSISAIGVSVPGGVRNSIVYDAVNIAMDNYNLGEHLSQLTNITVKCENDANAALLGEVRYGSLKNMNIQHAVMLTLGTGVGGALYLGKKLYKGIGGAGEFGHMTIIDEGIRCPCGNKGCFEQYASASALLKQVKESENLEKSLIWSLCNGKKEDIDGRIFFAAVESSDLLALDILERFTNYLAKGIINVVCIVAPEAIIIGGGISQAGEFLLAPLRKKLSDAGFHGVLVQAELKNTAGMYGVIDL